MKNLVMTLLCFLLLSSVTLNPQTKVNQSGLTIF
jgi:hypothetical protein